MQRLATEYFFPSCSLSISLTSGGLCEHHPIVWVVDVANMAAGNTHVVSDAADARRARLLRALRVQEVRKVRRHNAVCLCVRVCVCVCVSVL